MLKTILAIIWIISGLGMLAILGLLVKIADSIPFHPSYVFVWLIFLVSVWSVPSKIVSYCEKKIPNMKSFWQLQVWFGKPLLGYTRPSVIMFGTVLFIMAIHLFWFHDPFSLFE